jgi:hypothetical protein
MLYFCFMQSEINFCRYKYPQLSAATYRTYLGWIRRLKCFSHQDKATVVTIHDIISFLASLHLHSRRTQQNAKQAVCAVYRYVLWDAMPSDFQQAFLLRLANPLRSRHRTGRWKKRFGKLPAPDVALPSPEHCEQWLALLTPGKPKRACLRVYAEGLPPHVSAKKHRTSVPAMQKILRQARSQANKIGFEISTGTGLRALRTVHILNRIRAGDDPASICTEVGMRHLSSLRPYLRLAACLP